MYDFEKSTFVALRDAKASGLIPEEFHQYFKDMCPVCNEDMIISRTRKILKCGNTHCYHVITSQIVNILQTLGFKGYGHSTILSYVISGKMSSMCEFIAEPPPQFFNLIGLIRNLNYTFPQLVQLMAIPRLDVLSLQLFEGINSFDEFLNYCAENGGLEAAIQSKIGGEIMAVQIAQIIQHFGDEIEWFTENVGAKKQAKNHILIAITRGIGRTQGPQGEKLTKQKYIDYLNNILEGSDIEVQLSEKMRSVSFVVADYPDNTAKYQVGAERNILITSDNLLAVVQQLAEKRSKHE